MLELQRREQETDRKMRLVLDWLVQRVQARMLGKIRGRILVEINMDECYASKVRLLDSRVDYLRPDEVAGWLDRVQAERRGDGLKGRITAAIGTGDGDGVTTTEEITLLDTAQTA